MDYYIGLTPDKPIKTSQELVKDPFFSEANLELVGKVVNNQKILNLVGREVNKRNIIVLVECLKCGIFSERYIGHVIRRKKCNCGRSKLRQEFKKENKVWRSMWQRCINPNEDSFYRYGGRGIEVCREWIIFDNFIKDMGPRPSDKHQIERIDNNKGYNKENCKWVVASQNMRNTRRARIELYKGENTHIYDIAEKEGISKSKIDSRWNKGIRGSKLWAI